MPPPDSRPATWTERLKPVGEAVVRGYHRYANWLVGISWRRFILLSLLLLVTTAILQSVPPFSYRVTEWVDEPIRAPRLPKMPELPKVPPAAGTPDGKKEPVVRIHSGGDKGGGVQISIDERGVRISPRSAPAPGAASAPASSPDLVRIELPPGVAREVAGEVRQAVEEAMNDARQASQDAGEVVRDAQQAVRDAQEAAREAIAEAQAAIEAARQGATRRVQRTRTVEHGSSLPELAMLWIIASAILKLVYKGRIQAEAKAAKAAETAEAESLRRQVVEARMAAMQAQVEPHFLFNTLASIDHLIETDPPRASRMQKNLIALLRASMPSMREANANGGRDLGRELAVIRPYLEILKVRMEERLTTSIDVPEGLHSAEFPPMMIQSLVENAIKHGLEPKPEGGSLAVKAEVRHGKLVLSVADTGLGFGRAATAGTGVGLANIRERLQLLYGTQATLTVTENQPSGTVVTITVPYKSVGQAAADADQGVPA